MFFGKKKVLGLDIGTSSIKIAELSISGQSAHLVNFAMMETPATAISNADIVDVEPISQTIATLLRNGKFKRKSAVAGLWGSSLIVKKITIPRMDESLVGEQIRWEAEQYIPFDLSEINLDYHLLKTSDDSHDDNMDVLIVAAKHEQVSKYIEMVETSGLNCTHLDVNGFALANIFEANYGSTKGQMVGLFNIGAHYVNFVVVKNREPIFSRDITAGGQIYTHEIQKTLATSYEESEALKLNMNVGQDTPEEVYSAIHSGHEILVDEIRASVDFFINTTQGAILDRCYITGGGAKTWGISEAISQGLNIPCEILNPFMRVNSKLIHRDPSYLESIKSFASIACGLGLRMVGDS